MQSSSRKDTTAESSIDWSSTSDKGETSRSGTEGNVGGSWSWGNATTDTTGGWGIDKNVGWADNDGGGWNTGGKASSTVSSGNDQNAKGKESWREDTRDSSPHFGVIIPVQFQLGTTRMPKERRGSGKISK